MTVSTSTNVKLAGLNVVIAGMRTVAPARLKLYIVVPDVIFDKFTTVTVKGPDGSSTEWPTRIPSVNRFVLRIPIQRGKKRTREDEVLSAKETLEEAAIPNPIIDELVNSSRTDAADSATGPWDNHDEEQKHEMDSYWRLPCGGPYSHCLQADAPGCALLCGRDSSCCNTLKCIYFTVR